MATVYSKIRCKYRATRKHALRTDTDVVAKVMLRIIFVEDFKAFVTALFAGSRQSSLQYLCQDVIAMLRGHYLTSKKLAYNQ